MSYEKKALGSIDKIIDAIFYEEGRLAIVNKYGATLDDADKVKATELIQKQRTNLDRLFGIYKEQLEPVMTDIDAVSEEMEPLVGKLLAAQKIAQQIVFDQQVEAAKAADNTVVEEPVVATSDENVVAAGGDAPVEGVVSEEAATISEPVVDTPVATEETAVVADAPVEGGAVDEAVATDENNAVVGADTSVSDAAPVDGGTNETEESTEFVLSPIDEDVAPANSEEKAAEEGAAVVDQQLQAIDAVKEEISNNPDLTAEEKKVELEKYTRVSDAAVKAILVTKAQYEKLLASKASQKALMNPEKKEEIANEVGGIPAIVGGDAPAEVKADDAAAAVVLPTIDTTAATDTPAVSETPAATEAATADATSAPVLPIIESAPANDAPVSNETPADSAVEGVVLPTIVPGGDAPATDATSLATADAVDKQKELQTMIDQANNLYKEGKTQEAQELFAKVGAINKEMQGAASADAPATDTPAVELPVVENSDAAVLVKK